MMSQSAAIRKFREALISEGATPQLVDRLLMLANRHQVLEMIRLNENVGSKFDAEGRELEHALRACVQDPITGIHLYGDPRGNTVKINVKSGRWDTLGGKEDGLAVPTRDYTAAYIERAARMPCKHWIKGALDPQPA